MQEFEQGFEKIIKKRKRNDYEHELSKKEKKKMVKQRRRARQDKRINEEVE